MESLNRIRQAGTRYERTITFAIQALIVASMVAFSLETLPNLSQSARVGLRYFEIFSVLVFTVEYIVRLVRAENRIRFVTSFFGIIDLLAIV